MNSLERKVIGKECRHVTYCTSNDKKSDCVVIKEYLHFDNGDIESNLRIVENLNRRFWVAKKARRDYSDKIQWIKKEDCDEYICPEIDFIRRADKALGGYGGIKTKKQLFESPYLFGCGVSQASMWRTMYNTRYKDFMSKQAKVAIIDTETDVLNGTEEIIIACITFKDKAYLGIDRKFFHGEMEETIVAKLKQKEKELIGDYIEKRNMNVVYELFDNAGEITKAILDKAHEWEPDFVGFWNMNFDIKKMMGALEKYGYDLADCFSDPRVPKKYRFFKYKEGASVKTIHTGETKGINPEARWHIVECPASFFFIDGMTLYYRVRMAGGLEEGYSLDAVLDRNLNITKLKIEELDGLIGIDWHVAMQREYKYDYCIYNLFDGISTEMLDEKTNDISVKLPAQCLNSCYTDFKSGPRKLSDGMHYYLLRNNYVIGVADGDISNDDDKHVIDINDWIITLPSHMSTGLGIDFIIE